jgi:hypothetical protein
VMSLRQFHLLRRTPRRSGPWLLLLIMINEWNLVKLLLLSASDVNE